LLIPILPQYLLFFPTATAQFQTSFTFVLDSAGAAHLRSVPYDCAGVLTDEIVCVNTTTDESVCSAKFDCVSGDCIGTVTQQRLRSIMYPVVGIIAAILWFAFPFAISTDTVKITAMVLSVAQAVFALTMLASPLVYVPLLVLASSTFTFHVYQSDRKTTSDFTIVGALATWLFLLLGGLNFLSNGNNNIPFFESLVSSFNTRECFLLFGSPLDDPRCKEYLLYCAVVTYVITVIQPALFLCAWGSWRTVATVRNKK